MRYDIEADWGLLNTCNFRCDYCFLAEGLLGEKLRRGAPPAQWRQAFDATGLTWLLHLTGGEPSLHPDFVELSATLAERHYLSINSNLTGPAWAAFAERLDPSRVAFVNAALHPAERARKGGLAAFLRHAELLRARGFRVMVSVVATPAVLADADAILAALRPAGIVPFPKVLRGAHAGAVYPQAYTHAERARFRSLAAAARRANASLLAAMAEHPTIDLANDDRMLDGVPAFTGRDCEAGVRFVAMHGNGDVFRCSSKEPLGNLLAGTLALNARAKPCDTGYCVYFCKKYAAEPRRGAGDAERTFSLAAALRRMRLPGLRA